MDESTRPEGRWTLVPPSQGEEWALRAGSGWISKADTERGATAAERVRQLEERAATLQQEIALARDAGYAAGLEAGRAEVEGILDGVRAERDRLAREAAAVACELAVGVVGQTIVTEPDALKAWAGRALTGSIAMSDVERVEVPGPLTAALATLLSPLRIVGVTDLGPADARVIMTSGKHEFRLAQVLEALVPQIRERLELGR